MACQYNRWLSPFSTTLTAPGSKEWGFGYNALGQLTQTINPNGPTSKQGGAFQCTLPGKSRYKLNPNGLIETYGYDSRNRLTRRYLGTEATGGTDLEEFVYALDNAGNITTTTELDGTVWDYEYDDRYRLTLAEAHIGTKAKWKEAYVYDDGDNLLTKHTPVQDNFDDLDDSDWVGAAHWTAANGYLENNDTVNTYGTSTCLPQDEDDFQAWFSYRMDGTALEEGVVILRENTGGGQLKLQILYNKLVLRETSVLDDYIVSLDGDTWYEFYAKCDGSNVEVWYREKGTTEDMTKILETTSP